jgi:hypothetical protein
LIPEIYRKPLGVRVPKGFPWPQNTRRDKLGKWEERQWSRRTEGSERATMASVFRSSERCKASVKTTEPN